MSKRTVVVKVGTSTLTAADGRLDRELLSSLVLQIAQIAERGDRTVLVSSGAIAAGMEALGLSARPCDIPTLQATAAVGQVRLVQTYEELFAEQDMHIGQVLLTRQDTGHRQQYLHAAHTLERLLELGVTPVVNENDTTAIDEIRFGDNDTLAALVALMVHADLVVLLTDIDGLYSADPRTHEEAHLVTRVEEVSDQVMGCAAGPGTPMGSGGMTTKLQAAQVLMKAGIPMVVCDGKREDALCDAAAGVPVGTLFVGGQAALTSHKLWIAYVGRPAGSISIDDGAADALRLRGKSLLPAGVVDVAGSFVPGDPVLVISSAGTPVARGLVMMSAEDLRKVKGMKSEQVRSVLADWEGEEVVHRDHLVIV